MSNLGHQLHIFFLPFMAHGHTIPMVDIVKLFASRGVKTTIITTPVNAPLFSKTIERLNRLGGINTIDIKIIKFDTEAAGLPEGCENVDILDSYENAKELLFKFFVGTSTLQGPLEKLLEEIHPDCLVADMFFPWAADTASKFGIPNLVFHGMSFFALSASQCVRLYQPYEYVSSDSEPFVIPNLPGEVKITRMQLPEHLREGEETDFAKLFNASVESERKSFGVIVNSFYELEPEYADFYRKFLGRQAWHIGPVSLCNKEIEDKTNRGKETSIAEHECLKWLDSKKLGSVIYICFGSGGKFTSIQLKEIAKALEATRQDFIWVVNRERKDQEDWLPEGFEERIKAKGLIIRGWAPQVLILDHEAVGGLVTHCGWNSTSEGIAAGKPMITWPLYAEQFYNEKLVTEVLKIGVGVGVKKWARNFYGDFVSSEAIERAIKSIMNGEGAEEMRSRAKKLREMAKRAVEVGGSSYSDFNALIDELRRYRP